MSNRRGSPQGFTLIELLIVIAIIGFLASAILVAVDPVKRIQDSRDSRRFAESNAILNAILTKQVDDRAIYVGGGVAGTDAPIITQGGSNVQVIVTDTTGIVCNAGGAAGTARPGCNRAMDTSGANKNCVVNLGTDATATPLVPNYIASIPTDPRGAGNVFCGTGSGCATIGTVVLGTTNSGYYLARTSGNRYEIGACNGEQTATISVKR